MQKNTLAYDGKAVLADGRYLDTMFLNGYMSDTYDTFAAILVTTKENEAGDCEATYYCNGEEYTDTLRNWEWDGSRLGNIVPGMEC